MNIIHFKSLGGADTIIFHSSSLIIHFIKGAIHTELLLFVICNKFPPSSSS